ncbi:MAG: prolyl oligopeptidase family serine peptidase [Halobacteriaceae archaeon]
MAFLADHTGRPELFVADVEGEDPVQVTDGELHGNAHGGAYCWAHDGSALYVVGVDGDDRATTTVYHVQLRDSDDNTETEDPVTTADQGRRTRLLAAGPIGVIADHWDRTVAETGDLYAIDPDSGTESRLTDHGRRVVAVVPHPDDERVAYAVRDPGDDGWWSGDERLHLYDGTAATTLDVGVPATPVAWDRDGNRLLLDGRGDMGRIGWWAEGDVRWLGPGTPHAVLPDGDILAIRDDEPVVVPEDGEMAIPFPSVSDASGDVAVTTVSDEPSTHLVGGPLHSDPTTLATVEAEIPTTAFREPRVTEYVDSAGEAAPVQVTLPDETPAPVVVHLYGVTGDLEPFKPSRPKQRGIQWLVDQGYAVVEPGHGGETYNERRHADHAALGRWVQDQSWAGPIIAAIGHSSGGFDVLMQLTRYPEPWTAGVTWNPLVSLPDYHAVMAKDRPALESALGDPTENSAAWLALDPFEYLDGTMGPLLLLVGEHEPLAEVARTLGDALREYEVRVEYAALADERHYSRVLDQRVRRWRHITRFFAEVL